jgi:hypothetical protein
MIRPFLIIALGLAAGSAGAQPKDIDNYIFVRTTEPVLVAMAVAEHCPGWGYASVLRQRISTVRDEPAVAGPLADLEAIFAAEPTRACQRAIDLYGPAGVLSPGTIAPLSAPQGFIAEFKK